MIQPKFEVKLNSNHFEDIQFENIDENKLLLQQFNKEEENVYICLNGTQLVMDLDELYMAVKMLKKSKKIFKKKNKISAKKNRKSIGSE